MKPINEMTDEELEAIANGPDDLSSIPESELQAIAGEPSAAPSIAEPTVGTAPALAGKLTMGAAPLAAGLGAVAGYLSEGGSLAESKAMFDQARDDYNNDVARAEKAHPTLGKITDVGEFVTKAMPSGRAANFGISIAEQVGRGGLTPESIATGATFAALGEGVGKGLGAAAGYINRWGKTVNLSNAMDSIGVTLPSSKAALFNTLLAKKVEPEKFIQKVSEYEVNGAPIFEGSLSNIRMKTGQKLEMLGTELGDLMVNLGQQMPEGIPASRLGREIQETLAELSNTPVPKEINMVNSIKTKLLDLQDKGLLSLKDLHNFKEYIGKSIDWNDNTSKAMNSRLEKLFFQTSSFLKNTVDDLPIDAELKNSLRAVNDEYSNLMVLNKITAKDPGKEFAKIAEGSRLATAIGDFVLSPVKGIGSILNTTILDPMAKSGLVKVLTGFEGGLENLTPYITKITEGLARDPSVINDIIAPAESATELSIAPLNRTTDSLIANEHHIYNLLREDDPVLAKKFNDSMQNEEYDVVGSLMSDLSRLPRYKAYIQPGIGWDGKVTNEVEKNLVRSQIMGADLSVIQQMQQVEALEKSGIIPQAQPKVELRQIAKKPLRSSGRKIQEY